MSACEPGEIATVLIGIAEKILADLGDDRSAATDLLAADALITYAMESAAESRGDLESFAADAAARIARVARA